jgi:hypothetical protein
MSANTQARSSTPLTHATASADELSPLEQEVLDEYARLADNLNNVGQSNINGTVSQYERLLTYLCRSWRISFLQWKVHLQFSF